MAVETRLMTAEEFWARANEFSGCELVNGVVVPKHPEWRRGAMSPTSRQHGRIEVKLGTRISIFLQAHDLGEAYSGEVGFILSKDPDVVRAPDLAFVSHDRLKGVGEDGYLPLAPDLAIEIVSPGDTSREVQRKVIKYLDAGTRMVWIVDPDLETVSVYRSLSDVRILKTEDTLDGADVLPGFTVKVQEIFE